MLSADTQLKLVVTSKNRQTDRFVGKIREFFDAVFDICSPAQASTHCTCRCRRWPEEMPWSDLNQTCDSNTLLYFRSRGCFFFFCVGADSDEGYLRHGASRQFRGLLDVGHICAQIRRAFATSLICFADWIPPDSVVSCSVCTFWLASL